jgi:hypothetical protein
MHDSKLMYSGKAKSPYLWELICLVGAQLRSLRATEPVGSGRKINVKGVTKRSVGSSPSELVGRGTYLVGVNEGLAQRQLDGERRLGGRLQVHRDEGSGHRGVAGQEERLALLEGPGEPIADGVRAEVRSVVAHADDYRPRMSLACN